MDEEMRLIVANALKDRIRQEPTDGMYTAEILEAIDEVPTVDAVPVVRCRDCFFSSTFRNCLYCDHARGPAGVVDPEHFCAFGKRGESN